VENWATNTSCDHSDCFLNQLESMLGQVSEHEISEKIKNFIKEEFGQNPPEILLWEQMAFDFTESYSNDKSGWGTYFGPISVLPDKEGKMVECPSIQKITPEIISYWEQRAKESNNSVLKARYSNLVLHKYDVDVIKKLERALSLALSINDGKRVNKLVDVIINYEEKIAEDGKPGLWGFPYELLVKNKKVQLSINKEQKIVNELEKRLERLLKGNNHWAAKRAVVLLVDYYLRHGEKKKADDILLKLGEMVQRQAEQASSLVASTWLEELYHLYLQHGLKNEANNSLKKIKELGKDVKSELKKIETSIELPKEKQDLSKKAPISYLFAHRIMDDEGRIIATVGPLENAVDGHIVLQISQNMQISSFFLRETINALNKFNLNTAILEYFYKSLIFDKERKEFFIRGIDAFLDEDFLASLHILIPQTEALIRNLAEKIGIPILKYSRSGGFFYRTLDELLRGENIIKVLGEDMCLYLRVLLTDPRGWNLRNNICHGISKPENFNQIAADRIFHALLCLALVKEKEEKE